MVLAWAPLLSQGASLKGVVVEAATGEPITGATLKLTPGAA